MACAAMTYSRRFDELGDPTIDEVIPLHNEQPFVFTCTEDPQNVQSRFMRWLEESIDLGLERWHISQK